MVKTGLDKYPERILPFIRNKKVAVLCHAPSINSSYRHILDIIMESASVHLSAIFGPQHGLFGQTQDNMIEWEGYADPKYQVPVYSL
ncbi:MAG: exo-beta-N-acetylmuramidase NamZ domain-containing protein, partial [Bacteroidales bacterium]|nr:exo-beta-N-acetylmuramidase NamZ domain-containing protein [Bacteroidales bacterium]